MAKALSLYDGSFATEPHSFILPLSLSSPAYKVLPQLSSSSEQNSLIFFYITCFSEQSCNPRSRNFLPARNKQRQAMKQEPNHIRRLDQKNNRFISILLDFYLVIKKEGVIIFYPYIRV